MHVTVMISNDHTGDLEEMWALTGEDPEWTLTCVMPPKPVDGDPYPEDYSKIGTVGEALAALGIIEGDSNGIAQAGSQLHFRRVGQDWEER